MTGPKDGMKKGRSFQSGPVHGVLNHRFSTPMRPHVIRRFIPSPREMLMHLMTAAQMVEVILLHAHAA